MKKVININFQGSVVPIEESSYELLQQYIESLRVYFANEEGKDEIINDIESRISELFQEKLKSGSTCITDEDVNVIFQNMGRPEDFEEAEVGEKTMSEGAGTYTDTGSARFSLKGKRLYRDENHKILGGVCSGIAAYLGIDPVIVRVLFIISGIGFLAYILLWIFVPGSNVLVNGARKRLYRNPDAKIIGGVCSGMGSYFNVNPWIPRAFFLIPFISFFFRWGHFGPLTFPNFLSFSFSPGTLIIYIILWLVIPEALTTSEKLEMKGEKVDLNSIKNSVVQEMEGVRERVTKMSQDAGSRAREKSGDMGREVKYAAKKTTGAIGNIIVTLFKIFAYFILGCIALALIVALFSLAIVSIGLFPLKDFVLNDGWQSVLAWGTLIFFIGVPVVGIITFIIRRIARIKSHNRVIRYSFLGLWFLGIICFVSLLISTAGDFRRTSSANEQMIRLDSPQVASLEVNSLDYNRYNRNNSWFRLEPFATFDDDTAYIGNVRLRVEKAVADSFQVGVMKMCNGKTRRYADTLASLINYNVFQRDSFLMIDRAIAINTTDKFRNQNVMVVVYVPVGKHIKINKNLRNSRNIRVEGPWHDDNWYDWDDDNYYFQYGVEYIMQEDGLYTLSGIRAGDYEKYQNDWQSEQDERRNNNHRNSNDDSYRYDQQTEVDSLRIIKEKEMEEIQKSVDSLKSVKEKQIMKMRDSLRQAKEKLEQKLEKLNDNAISEQASYRKGIPENSFIMHI
ncbi:MAG: PspC domain-containing protein [Ginsengibacter sp.]